MITEKDIKRMATLAKIEIAEEDMAFYMQEMQSLLSFAESLDSVADLSDREDDSSKNQPLREDKVTSSVSNEDALSNSKDSENGFVKLRKRT